MIGQIFHKHPVQRPTALITQLGDNILKEGNDVLIRNQTKLDWDAIKKSLKDELGDERDLATLITKIYQIRQGIQDLTTYYQICKKKNF